MVLQLNWCKRLRYTDGNFDQFTDIINFYVARMAKGNPTVLFGSVCKEFTYFSLRQRFSEHLQHSTNEGSETRLAFVFTGIFFKTKNCYLI